MQQPFAPVSLFADKTDDVFKNKSETRNNDNIVTLDLSSENTFGNNSDGGEGVFTDNLFYFAWKKG